MITSLLFLPPKGAPPFLQHREVPGGGSGASERVGRVSEAEGIRAGRTSPENSRSHSNQFQVRSGDHESPPPPAKRRSSPSSRRQCSSSFSRRRRCHDSEMFLNVLNGLGGSLERFPTNSKRRQVLPLNQVNFRDPISVPKCK